MVREIVKWKCAVLYLVTLNVLAKSLPIDIQSTNSIITTETAFTNANEVTVKTPEEMLEENVQATLVERSNFTKSFNITRNTLLRDIRPGQQVRQYVVSITFDDNRFHGRAVIDVVVTAATRGDNLLFHFDNVAINSVQTGVFTIASAVNADYDLDDGILEIEPVQDATSYIVIVEYTGVLSNTGRGLYIGEGHGLSYIGMNLYPTNARRVFPCMDDPTEAATVSFTFTDVGYTNIITNSIRDDSNTVSGENQFRTLIGPVHTWGMIAHNFINLNIPTTNVLLVGRSGVSNQDSQSSLAINAYFAYFNDWTDMEFFDIVMNQETRLHFLALPDVDREWNTLSTIGIWEPNILMENVASVKQRKTVLVKVAEALARQWFGYVIHPQNWRHEWVVSGFATYSAYEAVRSFQSSATGSDVTLLDMNTLFITDVIQESLLQDSYASTPPLLVAEDLLDEEAIRDYIFSVQRWKAPALMHMMRMILGSNDHDPIQVAAQALLTGRALETVNSQNFIDAMSSGLLVTGSNFIDDFEEYLEPWIENNGYPILHVGLRQGGVLVTQERFGFSARPHINFPIPITYTTSINPDFSDNNIRPVVVTDATVAFNMFLDEEDWVLFNIQGQGYYRVNYDGELWERIIEALEDEVLREVIHPLNRATLVDDALNLARAGKLDYDIAFRVVLSMEHETEYPVWKAFVRNMDFLRKRLVALVTDDDDDDFDPDIYLRMVRRTIVTLEDELGFYPDPLVTEPAMVSLTRGLVMDHACRANYIPCIAAAKDWFYDPNSNNDVVNPNIPYEIRPAVYCTMVREGDENVIEALENRLELEASHYERVVILEALACSQDDNYISQLLMETITGDKYLTEERVKIFKAVAESSYHNAELAVNFISRRAAEIRDWYGGDEKLEEVIFHLADNMADAGLSTDFEIFVNSQNNNLDDSQLIADRALLLVQENRLWDDNLMEYVYEWIDENDAPTLAVSLALVSITFMITLFNH